MCGALVLVTGRVSDQVGRCKLAIIGYLITSSMTLICSLTARVPLLLLIQRGDRRRHRLLLAVDHRVVPRRSDRCATSETVDHVRGGMEHGSPSWLRLHRSHLPALAHLAFYGSAGVTLLIAALLLFPARFVVTPEGSTFCATLSTIPAALGDFRNTAWLALFGTNFALDGTSALFPQLATHLGIGADVHGGLLALGRGAALTSVVALQLSMFWRSQLWPLWVAQLLCAASILVIWLANAIWMFALAWMVGGAVSGCTYQASITLRLRKWPQRARAAAFTRSSSVSACSSDRRSQDGSGTTAR